MMCVNLEPTSWCNSTVDVKFTIKLSFLVLILDCSYRQTLIFLCELEGFVQDIVVAKGKDLVV